ncbi:MAG: tgtA5 cluster protein 1 [Gemmatimonadales bacterium]|nr:tgtA5 cluster protein 1 [Gemmatimonadales bacterium]
MTSQLHLVEVDEVSTRVLRLPALEVDQGSGRLLYSFAVDGKKLPMFATVSRVQRAEDAEIHGYQRPEVRNHIASIKRYIESEAPMIPNALVVAFDKRVHFEPLPGSNTIEYARQGTLVVPISDETAGDKPGWIVDGQQRTAAIREARVDSFPICVVAFIADSSEEQRSQFILVNSTKPLPKGLIHELLPETKGTLPIPLQLRRFPTTLLYRLNYTVDSPFYRLIQTPTNPEGVVKDNPVIKMLENSLSDGVLYRHRDPETGTGDEDVMLAPLHDFWSAVSRVFPEAWAKPPRKSRLMHGVGIVSLGFLMDAICDRYMRVRPPTSKDFENDLEKLKDICRWTNGYWDFGPQQQRKWNELQNTSKDIQLLTNYLLFEYKTRVWSGAVDRRSKA